LRVPSNASLLDWIAQQPPEFRKELFRGNSAEEIEALEYSWPLHARPNQLTPPGTWSTWLVLAGRGFGKTRTGGEFIRDEQEAGKDRMALVGPTASDVREVMVEGESGLLAICPPWNRPEYEPSKRQLTWPNGARAITYSAEEPDRLRGPQHESAWCDEAAAWKYGVEVWDNLQFGLRLGTNPRTCVTGTPKPVKLIRDLLADPTTFTTRGSSYDNRSNLPAKWFKHLIRKYEGTRLGRQELLAELLEDTPGALWTRALIETARVAACPCALVRVVVAIDPAVTSGEEADETGIIVAGLGLDGHGYVFNDCTLRALPADWAKTAIAQYRYWKCDRIIGEANNGGEMIEATLRMIDPTVPYTAVHASRGKVTRAEPVSALYEQGRIHHVGMFELLEDQQCAFVPGAMEKSPDRVDALVWAISELMIDEPEIEGVIYYYDDRGISPI
jgi:phage terminase large subunit-like protein